MPGREQAEVFRPQRGAERVVDAAGRGVEVRVHAYGGYAVPQHGGKLAAREVVRGDALHGREADGMVRDDKLRAEIRRLGDDAVRDVERDEDARHLRRRVAAEEARVVKIELGVQRGL